MHASDYVDAEQPKEIDWSDFRATETEQYGTGAWWELSPVDQECQGASQDTESLARANHLFVDALK